MTDLEKCRIIAQALDRYVHEHHETLTDDEVAALKEHAELMRSFELTGGVGEPTPDPVTVAEDEGDSGEGDGPPPDDGGEDGH